MKITMIAAVLMSMTVAAHAELPRLRGEASPVRTVSFPSQQAPMRPTLVAPIRIDELPTSLVSPVELEVGVMVAAPRLVIPRLHVQLTIDGSVAAQGPVPAGTARRFTAIVKADGQAHEMRVRVYRETSQGQRTLAEDRTFELRVPAP